MRANSWPAVVAATLGLGAVPLQAQVQPQPICWDDATLAAARLHEFHIRLNVSALHCRSTRSDIETAIAAYSGVHGGQLAAAETHVRSAIEALAPTQKRPFTTYVAALGNRYGASSTSPGFCALLGEMLGDLTRPESTPDDLHTYALLLVREPMIEQRCAARQMVAREPGPAAAAPAAGE